MTKIKSINPNQLYIAQNAKVSLMKDKNKTTIKTIYGNVEYTRRYYVDTETGKYVYLLDEEMNMNRVGMFSENMANLIIKECINEPLPVPII